MDYAQWDGNGYNLVDGGNSIETIESLKQVDRALW